MSDETTSDETTRTDGWATADGSRGAAEGEASAQTASQAGRTSGAPENAARPRAFCQDCGRGLDPEARRTVGAGVFCEPCLDRRLQQGAGVYGTVPGTGATQGPPPPGMYGMAPAPGESSPVLAGLLGLIPGVGAMYNGQFAKGVMHLIVFVILVFMSNNVSSIFGLFVAGWIFYQAFEAYHTAVARRDGLPLPNPFGFNDIGERMGFGRARGGAGQVPPGTPWAEAPAPVPPAGSAPTTTPGSNWAGYAPPMAGPDWVGYVPPMAFAGPPTNPVPPAEAVGQAQHAASSWNRAPYVETYTGSGGAPTPGYSTPPFTPVGQVPPVPPVRRFPVGALWLIGLGVLILLANLLPDWRISSRWWPPVLFAGLSLWLFTRRLQSGGARIACIVRWPVILMVLAVMFALHAAYFVVTFGMMCAVLLITIGVLLVLERTLGAGPDYGAAEPPRATFTDAGPAEPAEPNDVAKGGL